MKTMILKASGNGKGASKSETANLLLLANLPAHHPIRLMKHFLPRGEDAETILRMTLENV